MAMGVRLEYTLKQLCPIVAAEIQGGDKGKNTAAEGDKDKDDEDMRETDEWVAASEDDLFDGDEIVDYDEDDKPVDENVDTDADQKNIDDDIVGKALVFCPDDKLDPRFALGMKFSHRKDF
ncbi:UNVERIFIED_CONTAM: hypothetical protein Sindi_0835400 [Sesamum indicum]